MVDKTQIEHQEFSNDGESTASERRRFLRRAALIGLPAIVATVQPRTAWAASKGQSVVGSVNPSGTGGGAAGGGNGLGWQKPAPAKPRGNGSLW